VGGDDGEGGEDISAPTLALPHQRGRGYVWMYVLIRMVKANRR